MLVNRWGGGRAHGLTSKPWHPPAKEVKFFVLEGCAVASCHGVVRFFTATFLPVARATVGNVTARFRGRLERRKPLKNGQRTLQ